jgi:hypothetical protein
MQISGIIALFSTADDSLGAMARYWRIAITPQLAYAPSAGAYCRSTESRA